MSLTHWSARRIAAAAMILLAGAGCTSTSRGLGGAALPQEAATAVNQAVGDHEADGASLASAEVISDGVTLTGAAAITDVVAEAHAAGGDAPTGAGGAEAAAALPRCPPRCARPITILPDASTGFSGRVVFVSDRGGKRQLYVGDATKPSGQPAAIPGTAGPETRGPVWSPDGKVIAYLTSDIIVGSGASDAIATIAIVDAAGTPLAWFHAPELGLGGQRLDYLTWSTNGDKLCFSHYLDWSKRGLSCLEFPTYKPGGPYNWGTFQMRPVVAIGGKAKDGTVIAPSESTFSNGDGALYFSADVAATRGRLYRIAVPTSGTKISGQPTTLAYPVKDSLNAYIDLVFSPSFGVQSGKPSLLLNSECGTMAGSGCLDEELVRYDFGTQALTRLTTLPGNQYGSYGHGAGGAYVVQTSTSATGPADLALVTAGDVLSPAPFGDTGNKWNDDAPDWWVK